MKISTNQTFNRLFDLSISSSQDTKFLLNKSDLRGLFDFQIIENQDYFDYWLIEKWKKDIQRAINKKEIANDILTTK